LNIPEIIPSTFHASWDEFLNEEMLEKLWEIQTAVIDKCTPDKENIMKFLQNDLYSLKVVILGQDPYPEKGAATGRAFEVNGLCSWNSSFRQVSLKNIVRLLHKSYNNIEEYDYILSYSQIKREIEQGIFDILPPSQLFKSWEQQGVLLLNSYLTCEEGNPGSHRELWNSFTCSLLSFISEKKSELYWFLWGRNANVFSSCVKKGIIYSCRHPMMCSEKYEDDFLKSSCFADTKQLVNWLGYF